MDVARLNFSHGTHEDHAQNIAALRAAAIKIGKPIAILADLQGPKIRTGPLAGGQPVQLRTGQTLRHHDRENSRRFHSREHYVYVRCRAKCIAAIAFCFPMD